MTAPLFVRDETGQWVNLARAATIRVLEDRKHEGQWLVLAHFAGRASVVGRAGSRDDAEQIAEQLATRANAGEA